MAHVVGTARILASVHLPAPVLAAALLHNVYATGDFGDVRTGPSQARRRKIREALGSEVETYIAKFPTLYWKPQTIRIARYHPDKLDSTDCNVLSILFADHMEHLLDCDVFYYDDKAARFYIDHSKMAVEIADTLGLSKLAAKMREAIRQIESVELPVEIPERRNGSFVIVPRSCRKRLSVVLRQNLIDVAYKAGRKLRRDIRVVYAKSPEALKKALVKWTVKSGLEIRSEEFKELFPAGARPELVATGFRFTEGPVWNEEEKRLLFSDIPADRIYGLAADGRVMTLREPSGNSNGLTRDREGRLIACEHGNRRLTRSEKDGSVTPLADRFHGKKLNSPNDVVVKSDGAIYFTDPACGITPDQQEQPLEGVYRLSPDGKEISLVADDLARPNGLAFSPDEKKLYIDDSERRHIRVFDVSDDGSLSGGSVFHDMNVSIPGSPDGMKVDVEGRVYCTGAGGVWVFDPAGNHLGTIVTPEKPSNCAWGDDDWRSLYITATSSVYKIRVNTPGIRIP
jgi:gluconolactonase